MDKKYTVEYMDNDPLGWVSCTDISTGYKLVAYKIPRDKYMLHSKDAKIKKSGIYFLVANKRGKNDKPFLYIGKASQRANGEAFTRRLGEHDAPNDNCYGKWDYAIVVVQEHEELDARELQYLEATFIDITRKLNLYDPINTRTEQTGNPGEKDEVMDQFIEITKSLVYVLGFDLFGLGSQKTSRKIEKADTKKIKDKEIKQKEVSAHHSLGETGNPTGKNPTLVKIGNNLTEVKNWKDVAITICEYLYQYDQERMIQIANDNYRLGKKADSHVYISVEKEYIDKMRSPRIISGTKINVETHADALELLKFMSKLVEQFFIPLSKILIYY